MYYSATNSEPQWERNALHILDRDGFPNNVTTVEKNCILRVGFDILIIAQDTGLVFFREPEHKDSIAVQIVLMKSACSVNVKNCRLEYDIEYM